MKLIATMPARNEAWCLGLTARAVLRWCDELIILDHNSTDHTRKIAYEVSDEHPGRVAVESDAAAEWNEADQRQRLLDLARARSATHLAIIDADEVLCGTIRSQLRAECERLRPGEGLRLPWLCCWRDAFRYRTDAGSVWSTARAPVVFGIGPTVRWVAPGGYQFHRRFPDGVQFQDKGEHRTGGLMHLQFADWPRLLAKQAWYKVYERHRYGERKSVAELNEQYGKAADESGLQTQPVPAGSWDYAADLLPQLHLGRVPWHVADLRRMLAEMRPEQAAGLDLFGVV